MKNFIGSSAIAISILLVALLTIFRVEPEEISQPKNLMQVHVTSIESQTIIDIITGHGQVKARWETTLSSEVSGRVLSVSDKFLSGVTFNKEDVLATVDDTNYLAALAEANAALATAERTLKEENQRSKIASENWKTSGFKGKPTDLVLRKPQLVEARAEIESAKAAIKKAENDLRQTEITAPYDGIVIRRDINPGDFLQMGAPIGVIYDRSLYEISVPLAIDDIARLPKQENHYSVIIHSQEGDKQWLGKISRIEKVIDQQNRWQNVIVEVSDTDGLLPGVFTTIEFTGKRYQNIFAIPENMQASEGYIWYVDADNRLQRFMPDILFKRDGLFFVQAPSEKGFMPHFVIGKEIFLPNIVVKPIFAKDISLAVGG